MEKQINVPKLRFPEFVGEWEKGKLEKIDVSIIDGDRGTNYPNGNDFSNEGYCLFLNAKNVTKEGFSFEELSFITKEKDEELRKGKLLRHDIVLTTRGSVGHIAYFDNNIQFDNLRINSGMVLIRTNAKFVTQNFLYKYFNSIQIQNEIKTISFGSAQPQLTVGEIAKLQVAFPTLPEQAKIANFLTAAENKFTKLKNKKSLLEEYKKGVMQKIFSQELGFKDDNGEDFPEWEEKKIKEVTEYVDYRGKTPTKTDYGVFLVTAKNIKQGYIDYEISKEYIDSEDYDEVMRRGKPELGDVLITTEAPLGNVACIDREDVALAQRVIKLRGKKTVLQNLFLKHILMSSQFQNEIDMKGSGTTAKGIKGSELHNLLITFPSLPEQTKIANFLSAIDEKINHCSKQIEQMEDWKKGLLQQMFC